MFTSKAVSYLEENRTAVELGLCGCICFAALGVTDLPDHTTLHRSLLSGVYDLEK